MSNQCVHSGRQSTPKKALRRLGATVGTLGLAIAGAAATALPAQATDPACPVGVCTVNGNETVVHGTWTVNGPLVLAADETLRVASSGNIELEDGASISGDGKIVNEWNLYVFGSDVVISVPVENRKDGGGADGALTVSTGAGVTFKNVSLDNGGGVYSGGFIAFEGGSEPGQASNLINSGRVDNYGSMLFESGSDTGVTSKLVNEGDVFNGNGYMYFLKAEVEGSGTFDGTDEHAPLYSAFFASSVFEHQDDEGEIVAACAPTLTPDGGTIPPWANSETVDGVTVAFFYEGYAFDLLAPTSCSLEGQAR
ncbi:MAG: hypothetical protein LBH68_04685, partial [Bifidobacteriaceae bacterium]|nr:hypothetical protein [Bifidobacteriaceae bacterium]